ncbi:MAG: hypothetical protein ABI551_13340 [Polyangiaceae bacterium]
MAELKNQAADLSDEAPTLEITHVLTDAEARAVLADITQEVDVADVLAVAALGTTADTINTLPVGTPSPLLVERDPFAFKPDSIAPVAIAASLPPAASPPKRQATNPDIVARAKALRAEPTQVLPRILLTRIQETMKKKQARMALMLVAAIGSWAFFASFAALGVYGVVVAVRTHGQANQAVESAAATAPSSDGPAVAALPAHPVFIAEPVPERPRATALASTDEGADEASDEARSGAGKLGILRFAHATNGVLVDGAPHKVSGGALFVTCGAHRVRVPHGASHTVNVPCGRTVTL